MAGNEGDLVLYEGAVELQSPVRRLKGEERQVLGPVVHHPYARPQTTSCLPPERETVLGIDVIGGRVLR